MVYTLSDTVKLSKATVSTLNQVLVASRDAFDTKVSFAELVFILIVSNPGYKESRH